MKDDTTGLTQLRATLDGIDDRLIALLGERVEVCRQVARVKLVDGLAVLQESRAREVLDRCTRRGEAVNLRAGFVQALYQMIMDETCRVEHELIDAGTPRDTAGEGLRPSQG